jgi:hypothetical protein
MKARSLLLHRHAGLLGESGIHLPRRSGHGHGDGGRSEPEGHVIYSWSGTGVTGNGRHGEGGHQHHLAPGQYTVTGTVKEGKPGKEGMKPWETATCTAGITVKAFEPPTISCSASPARSLPAAPALSHRRREPAEPSADLQLFGHGGHGNGQRNDGGVLLGGRANRRWASPATCRMTRARRPAQTPA